MRPILHSAGVGLLLTGCVAHPQLPQQPDVDIVDIVENIECEIQQSLLTDLSDHYWLLGWATTITLDLETDNAAGGTGVVEISIPLTPETFGLSIAGGPEKEKISAGTFSYSTYLIDIAGRSCPADAPKKTDSSLTGETGVGAWLTRVARASNNAAANLCPNSIDFGLEFTLTMSGDGTPTISDVEIGTGVVDGVLDLSGSHVADHQLTLSAVPVVDQGTSSDMKTVDQIFTRASALVAQQTNTKMTKQQFTACSPLRGGPVLVQRQTVNSSTKQALDTAVAGQLLRSLAPTGGSAGD